MRASLTRTVMTIKSQLVGTTTILRVHGTMTAAAGERGLRDVIRQAVADGVRTVIVNMQDATSIDSSGVSDLASGHMILANNGGSLKLCCLSKKLRDVFVVTRLDKVFDLHETEAVLSGLTRPAFHGIFDEFGGYVHPVDPDMVAAVRVVKTVVVKVDPLRSVRPLAMVDIVLDDLAEHNSRPLPIVVRERDGRRGR